VNETIVGGAGIVTMGFITGSTACSLSCLPIVGPYLISTGRGFRDGIMTAASYMLGKICAYSAMSAGAAWVGRALVQVDMPHGRLIAGWALIGAGMILPLFSRRIRCGRTLHWGRGTSLFLVGVSTSFTPCLPLAGLFALAAQTGSVWTGLLYGLLYSTGLLIVPVLLAGGVLGMISETLRAKAGAFMPAVRGLSAVILMVMGIQMLWAL